MRLNGQIKVNEACYDQILLETNMGSHICIYMHIRANQVNY